MKRVRLSAIFSAIVLALQLTAAPLAHAANAGYQLVDNDESAGQYIPRGHLLDIPEYQIAGFSKSNLMQNPPYDNNAQEDDVIYYDNGYQHLFGEPSTTEGDHDVQGTVADVDGDGLSDFIGKRAGSNQTEIYIDYGNGNTASVWDPYASASCSTVSDSTNTEGRALNTIAVADLNYDGQPEIIYSSCGQVSIYNNKLEQVGHINISDLKTDVRGTSDPINSATPVIADFNGDGYADMAISMSYTNTSNQSKSFTFAYNMRDSVLWTLNDYGATSNAVAADFNGNGKAELAFGDASHIYIAENGAIIKTINQCGDYLLPVNATAASTLSLAAACNNGSVPNSTLSLYDPSTGGARAGYPVTFTSNKVRATPISVNLTKGVGTNDIVVPTEHGIIAINGETGGTLWTIDSSKTYDDLMVTTLNDQLALVAQGWPYIAPPGPAGAPARNTYVYRLFDPALTTNDPILPADQNTDSWLSYGNGEHRSFSLTQYPLKQADGEYTMVAADGGVFPFGKAGGYGSTGNIHLTKPMVGMTKTPSGHGYWLVASDGGVFPFGDAVGRGSTGNIRLTQPMVGMARTPSGNGYWLVAADGGVFPFGDAVGYGSTGNIRLNKPIVGMTATASGHGYWLVASDGGIFPFGDAVGKGSTGNVHLTKPMVGMAATASGQGYWLVAADGGIFPFGDAVGYGSAGNLHLTKPVVGMQRTPSGNGYWLVGADGGVFTYGDARYYGSTGDINLTQPIVGIAN